MERHAEGLSEVRAYADERMPLFRSNNGIVSFFDFVWKLVDIWVPLPSEWRRMKKPRGFVRAEPPSGSAPVLCMGSENETPSTANDRMTGLPA